MTKPIRHSRVGRTLAAGLGVVLIAGASLVASAPAFANNSVEVLASDIAPNEDTYTGWHQGYAAGAATITAEGLELSGQSQIINGLATPLGIEDLKTVVYGEQGSWTTTDASAPAFFQIPVFFGPDKAFTTLRPANPVAGLNTISATQEWVSSRDLGTHQKNVAAPLEELVGELEGLGDVQVLAFGVLSIDGPASVVSGISWLGTDYTFVQDPLAAGTATLTGDAVVGSTLSVSTAGWPAGTAFTYEWFWDGGQMGGAIEGATGTSYTVTEDVVTRKIGVIVTGTLAGNAPTSVYSNQTTAVVAPKQPVAAAPVADSTGLAAFLAAAGVTPQSQTDAGLPADALNPASTYTAAVAWFHADSFVDVYAYSAPVLVGTFPVVNGAVQISLTPTVLSKLAAGAHTLVITGQSSGAVEAVSLTVAAAAVTGASLAETGANPAAPLTAAALLLLLGSALVVVRRRRRLHV